MSATNLATLSREELEAMVLRFKAQGQRRMTMKVSEKGALSVYGLGRFPVTLYRGQWEKLLDDAVNIRQFIQDHADTLTTKD